MDSLEAIVERMRDLAKNRGDASRLNKGDRASSRGTFRDLLAIIQVRGWGVEDGVGLGLVCGAGQCRVDGAVGRRGWGCWAASRQHSGWGACQPITQS